MRGRVRDGRREPTEGFDGQVSEKMIPRQIEQQARRSDVRGLLLVDVAVDAVLLDEAVVRGDLAELGSAGADQRATVAAGDRDARRLPACRVSDDERRADGPGVRHGLIFSANLTGQREHLSPDTHISSSSSSEWPLVSGTKTSTSAQQSLRHAQKVQIAAQKLVTNQIQACSKSARGNKQWLTIFWPRLPSSASVMYGTAASQPEQRNSAYAPTKAITSAGQRQTERRETRPVPEPCRGQRRECRQSAQFEAVAKLIALPRTRRG